MAGAPWLMWQFGCVVYSEGVEGHRTGLTQRAKDYLRNIPWLNSSGISSLIPELQRTALPPKNPTFPSDPSRKHLLRQARDH